LCSRAWSPSWEQTIYTGRENIFFGLEAVLALFFAIEYALRLWVAPESGRYGDGWRARVRYAMTPAALCDLIAILPILFLAVGSDAFLLRFVRLIRLIRLARLGAFSDAITHLRDAVSLRRFELLLSVGVAGCLLLISSTLLYLFEADVQPDAFGSIPRAMWWSLVTLTTVGYGDVVPVTAPGRFFAGLTAITGIGLIALPTGILASAFSDVIQRRRQE
jgi:voltage-gated potassium channel